MKFGIFHLVPWHESRTQEQALREAMEEIELADRLGIDEVWLGEHRFSRHGAAVRHVELPGPGCRHAPSAFASAPRW